MVARPQKRTEGTGDNEDMWGAHVVVSLSIYSLTATEASGTAGGERRARIWMLEYCEGVADRNVERI